MKICHAVPCSILIGLLISCNFNINDNPEAQVSESIKLSKKHGAFICEYKVPEDTINGIKMDFIFAEKKYEFGESVSGRFTVDCCESQLVFGSYNFNYPTLNDVPLCPR